MKKNIYIISLISILVVCFLIIITQTNVFINYQEQKYKESTSINIREVDIIPEKITSAYADLNITAYLNYRGGETENASMVIRAIDSNTKLLNSEVTKKIPKLDQENNEKTTTVSQNLRVEKNGDYDLKILIFDNGSVLDSGSVSIRGINILTPQSKKYFVSMSNMDFIIGGTSGGRVALKPNIYLENTGAIASEDLKIIVKAREADSNILADRTVAETGTIESEKTTIKEVQLNVPDEYNYMIVVELWKDDTLINSWERPILLAPTKTIPKESQEKKVNIQVSDFVREGTRGEMPVPTSTPSSYAMPVETPPMPKEPGFEIILAIFAMILVLVYKKRRL